MGYVMGEIADSMINGEICRYCGIYLHDNDNFICEYGFEVSCHECAEDGDQFVHDNKQGMLIKWGDK